MYAPARDWRCSACGALLGKIVGGELHLKVTNRHGKTCNAYAALPARVECPDCRRWEHWPADGRA